MASYPSLAVVLGQIDARLAEVMHGSVARTQRPGPVQVKPTSYLLVVTGTLHLAIAEEDLSEAGPLPPITALPNLPSWIQGIVNIRGEIISVIDLPGFFTQNGRGGCTGQRVVVLLHNTRKIAIRLDRIVGRLSHPDTVTHPLEFLDHNPMLKSWFTSGLLVENQVYSLLNVRKLLTAQRLIDYNQVDCREER